MVKNPPGNARDAGDICSIPGSERSPGVGNGSPIQNSCLENSMETGAWQDTVHGILQARTLEGVDMPSFWRSSWLQDRTHISYVSCTGSGFFTISTTWEAHLMFIAPLYCFTFTKRLFSPSLLSAIRRVSSA